MSESPPNPSVTPSFIEVTGPGRSVTTSLDVVNRGGGRLQGTVHSSVPWITVEPDTIDGNHVLIAVNIDLSVIPDDQEAQATLIFRTDKQAIDIPVHVTREGMAQALRLYAQGNRADARELSRIISQTSDTADAAVLIAMTHLDEGNFSAAARSLLDAAEASLGVSFPSDTFLHFLERLEAALPYLRDARFAIGVLDRWLEEGTARSLECEAQVAALLSKAAERFALEFPPGVLAATDLAETRAQVLRWSLRFPDNPQWRDWLKQAAQVPVQSALKDRRPSRSSTLFRWAAVASVLAVACLVAWWPHYWRRQARSMLDAGLYAEALQANERAGSLGLDTEEVRTLRCNINFAWARALFGTRNEKRGAQRLEIALADAPDDPSMLDFKQRAYERWAETSLRKGQIQEGFEALQVVAQMRPRDVGLARRVESYREIWEVYVILGEIAAGTGVRGAVRPGRTGKSNSPPRESSVPLDIQNLLLAQEWRPVLRRQGIRWFDTRVQVIFVNLWGDGRQQVAIAGDDSSGLNALFIYAPAGTRLRKLFVITAAPGMRLDKMEQVSLDTGRPGLIVNWNAKGDSRTKPGHGYLIWGNDHGLHQWSPPGAVTEIEITDTDKKGHPTLWGSIRIGDSADVSILLPIPHRWTQRGPLAAPRDEEEFYNAIFLPQIRKELSSNPFPKYDRRHAKYAENRAKALNMVAAMLKK